MKRSMLIFMIICIDSCVFIQGIQQRTPTNTFFFYHLVPLTTLIIPRVVAREVTRNLKSAEHIRMFYLLFQNTTRCRIIDEPIPIDLVDKYIQIGLNYKGDAFIGAFAEWQKVDYLLSSNRHFLRDLHPETFMVLDVATFVARWDKGNL